MGDVLKSLRDQKFTFDKRYGQNFLTDRNLLEAIVSDSGAAGGVALEVGCGAGTLTRALAGACRRVVGFEIDARLAPVLGETLAACSNTEIHFEDFMKCDLGALEAEIGEPYRVVANLPYYITTPILLKVLEETRLASSLTVMVQEEVAERLCARPGTPEYGSVTVAVDLIGSARICRRVPRTLFTPPPNVDSAVVHVEIDGQKRARFLDETLRKLARCAFAMRRKTLANNIVSAFSLPREQVCAAISACGFPPDVRGERLSAEDFVRLAEELKRE